MERNSQVPPARRARGLVSALAAVLLLAALAAAPAGAQTCPPFICYIDLTPTGAPYPISGVPAFICPNNTVYPAAGRRAELTVPTSFNPGCTTTDWLAAVVQVDVPLGCSGIKVLVDYDGAPEGWTVNIGDSPTNNGFAGDSGSLPLGQNAEVQILDSTLSVFHGATAPPVDQIAHAQLALQDGSIKFVVEDQFLSWGNPYTFLDAHQFVKNLFFLPDPVGAGENRTLYVGLNRVVFPADPPGQDVSRNGCGARHAIIWTE
jgi:hypothetical protein